MTRALTSAGMVGTLICTTLAGCAYMPPAAVTAVAGRPVCTPDHTVLIQNILIDPTNPSNRLLTVDHDPVTVCQLQGGNVSWQITGALMYSFTDDGVNLIYGPPQWTRGARTKKQYDMIFTPPSPPIEAFWKYSINLMEDGNGIPAKKWTCDPTIVSYVGLYAAGIHTLSQPVTFTCIPLP